MSNFYLCLVFAGFFAVASSVPALKITPGNTDFAFKFYHQIALGAADNIFFSPLSISTVFALLLLGARSTTRSQLLSGLSLNQINEQEIHRDFHLLLQFLNRPNAEIELNIGNAVFTHDQLKVLNTFLSHAKKNYQAEVFPVNFKKPAEAEQQINSYIENKTQGKLIDVVKDLDEDIVMVLVNYIFMKAYWANPFNRDNTKDADFFVDEQTTVKVPTMNKDGLFKTYHDQGLSCVVVQLPYKGSASALFILPDPGKLKQVEDALGRDVFSKWVTSLKQQRINLFVPRLTMTSKYDVRDVLRRLGVIELFTNQADLSGITGTPELRVSKAIHQAYLNVHENGTEAAAVTVVDISPTSLPPEVKLNRPFFFIIFEEIIKTILFLGKVINPSKA
ncbi:alpha-1-antitrypsin-like [Elgaria multicarinata webbii]|uniref:alpha-1-antitrypsin-like n=1 Tax=Elgaria multicarinata webbii TaxID=159646 RepID=UPI002FCCBEEE